MSAFAVEQTIPEFFAGKNVFLTGGTGFLGKVLMEKLLRSCPKIGNIYVLVREKKNVQPEERLEKIVKLPLFERLTSENPDAFKKLILVNGDVKEINLGLSLHDRKTLMDTVNIVIHCAASIRFDDPLTDAIILNTRGTREVCRLVLEIKNLSVFVHVSTTYCNTDRRVIGEKLYPPHADWRQAIKIAENANRQTVDVLTAKYLGKLPNTYTFTKSMAEHVVNDLCGAKVPTVVFRPSIVISSMNEPMLGWIDNFNGPVGLLVACGKGIMYAGYVDPNVIADYMPVDLAIKGLIVAIWKKGTTKPTNEKLSPDFYNCSSYNQQHLTMGGLIEMGKALVPEMPLENPLWYPAGNVTGNKILFYLVFIFLQMLPAVIVDLILRIKGHKPMLVRIQRKIFIANMALIHFLFCQWSFTNEKMMELITTLSETDHPDFGYDIAATDISAYFRNAMVGVKMYLLREDMSEDGLRKAKKRASKMYILHQIVIYVFWFAVSWLLISSVYGFMLRTLAAY